MAQMSTIMMEYIDASMVGSLGPEPAASIGLVATTTWLFWGLGTAAVTGYAVQVAHLVGAGRNDDARSVLRLGLVVVLLWGLLLGGIAFGISSRLPVWLGGNAAINGDAASYFAIFGLTLPVTYLTFLCSSMLRCSGNMIVPGLVNVAMCVLDVVFNALMIFPTRTVHIGPISFTMPGADLGVTGAAIGTSLATAVCGVYIFYYLVTRSNKLSRPWRSGKTGRDGRRTTIFRACRISWPLAVERVVMCGAQIFVTAIVAPLGTAAIAANSFAVTAESLCYMPGYGISDASTTLVGQSCGAGRRGLAKSFGRITIMSGALVMATLGLVMWLFAPQMMSFFTTDGTIVSLGTESLRTVAWAEPMFGVAIVTYGVFVGAGYTIVPAVINFSCIWGVRITLSLILASSLGLFGVWLAMAIELAVRGLMFMLFFIRGRWVRKGISVDPALAKAEVCDAENPSQQPYEV